MTEILRATTLGLMPTSDTTPPTCSTTTLKKHESGATSNTTKDIRPNLTIRRKELTNRRSAETVKLNTRGNDSDDTGTGDVSDDVTVSVNINGKDDGTVEYCTRNSNSCLLPSRSANE